MIGPNSPSVLALLIPLVAIALPILYGCWQAARKRELEHIERMKALEMGRPLPGHRAWTGALCAAIGAGVPIAAMATGLIATMSGPFSSGSTMERMELIRDQGLGYYYAVWTSVAIIGTAAVICGAVLSALLLGKRERTEPVQAEAKYRLDPDAYDTVGSRG